MKVTPQHPVRQLFKAVVVTLVWFPADPMQEVDVGQPTEELQENNSDGRRLVPYTSNGSNELTIRTPR